MFAKVFLDNEKIDKKPTDGGGLNGGWVCRCDGNLAKNWLSNA
jgi:hypothetical protein